MFNVIYTWRGERHNAGQYVTLKEANEVCAKLVADKWRAWVEGVA